MLAARALPIGAGPHPSAAFGGDGQRAPILALHPAAHHLLGFAACIDIGGIEEINTFFHRGFQHRERLCVLNPSAEIDPGAQTDFRYLQAGSAQLPVVHNPYPPSMPSAGGEGVVDGVKRVRNAAISAATVTGLESINSAAEVSAPPGGVAPQPDSSTRRTCGYSCRIWARSSSPVMPTMP